MKTILRQLLGTTALGEGSWGDVRSHASSVEVKMSGASVVLMSCLYGMSEFGAQLRGWTTHLQRHRWIRDQEDLRFPALAASPAFWFSAPCGRLQPLKAKIQEETTQCVHLHCILQLWNKENRWGKGQVRTGAFFFSTNSASAAWVSLCPCNAEIKCFPVLPLCKY